MNKWCADFIQELETLEKDIEIYKQKKWNIMNLLVDEENGEWKIAMMLEEGKKKLNKCFVDSELVFVSQHDKSFLENAQIKDDIWKTVNIKYLQYYEKMKKAIHKIFFKEENRCKYPIRFLTAIQTEYEELEEIKKMIEKKFDSSEYFFMATKAEEILKKELELEKNIIVITDRQDLKQGSNSSSHTNVSNSDKIVIHPRNKAGVKKPKISDSKHKSTKHLLTHLENKNSIIDLLQASKPIISSNGEKSSMEPKITTNGNEMDQKNNVKQQKNLNEEFNYTTKLTTIEQNSVKFLIENVLRDGKKNFIICKKKTCPKCPNDVVMEFVDKYSCNYCPQCGLRIEDMDLTSPLVQEKENFGHMPFSYQSKGHFQTVIRKIIGKLKSYVPEDVIEEVRKELSKRGVKRLDQFTWNMCKTILKDLKKYKNVKFKDYYQHIYEIVNAIRGCPVMHLTDEEEEQIYAIYDQIGPLWEESLKELNIDRSNSMAITIEIQLIFYFLGFPSKINSMMTEIKGDKNQQDYSRIIKRICEKYGKRPILACQLADYENIDKKDILKVLGSSVSSNSSTPSTISFSSLSSSSSTSMPPPSKPPTSSIHKRLYEEENIDDDEFFDK